jgi:hypothetical protein
MDAPAPRIDRVVIACRACAWEDVLHLKLQCSSEHLRSVWRRCVTCDSPDISFEIATAGSVSGA